MVVILFPITEHYRKCPRRSVAIGAGLGLPDTRKGVVYGGLGDTQSLRQHRGMPRRAQRGCGRVRSGRCRGEMLVCQLLALAVLPLLGLVTPPRCGSPQAHSRSGRQVPRRVAALVCPLQDRCDDTRGRLHRPHRSGALADSGHIFSLECLAELHHASPHTPDAGRDAEAGLSSVCSARGSESLVAEDGGAPSGT
jgi:hypothetical protein